jgi:hypothetical protein
MDLVSIVLAYAALVLGLVAVAAMLFRLGRGGGGKDGAALLWVHRIAGYAFAAIMTFLFVGMLYKITEHGPALSPRVAWHGAAGFAVVAFLFLKWAVVRPFRGLMKFAPPLGMVVFGLAFLVVNFGATIDLLGRLPQEALEEEEVVAEHLKQPHMRFGAAERDPLRAARFVFAEKCGKCHHLRRPLALPRTETDWPPLIERMRSYDPNWISEVEAEEIELYLVNDYGPGN